jgi:hypothetical protein
MLRRDQAGEAIEEHIDLHEHDLLSDASALLTEELWSITDSFLLEVALDLRSSLVTHIERSLHEGLNLVVQALML